MLKLPDFKIQGAMYISDFRSKHHTLEQCTYMVGQYFRTNSYQIALRCFKEKFKKMPYAKTIKDTVYRNQLRTEGEFKNAMETEIKVIVEYVCENTG